VVTSRSGAPPVALVFGLDTAAVRWTTLQLRGEGVVAVSLSPDLPAAAAASVCAAADCGVHLVSARHGMDGTFLEYWQLLAEAGKARLAAVLDLGPDSLDVNESAAIASRVLEEDVLPATLPLLDDDESVIGALDVATGQQWLADGGVQPPRDDFSEAVEMETNALYDAAAEHGTEPLEALHHGLLAVAVTLHPRTGAGLEWLAQHLPRRSVPAATTILGDDGADTVLITAGPDGFTLGTAMAVLGTRAGVVEVRSLAGIVDHTLLARIEPGHSAAAQARPRPETGSWLVDVG